VAGVRARGRALSAPLRAHNYRTAVSLVKTFPDPVSVAWRYLTSRGAYPYSVRVRTPLGIVELDLYSAHDVLTVNESFNRVDYPADEHTRVIVDIGANIGVSAAYFATRSETARVYCYEPSPVNIERLQRNVAPFSDRVAVVPKAVGPTAGRLKFNAEPIGRYGGLITETYPHTENPIDVDVVTLDHVLSDVLGREGRIDILKIDTEGAEIPTIAAANGDLLKQISVIYLEAVPRGQIRPELTQHQRGEICVLRPHDSDEVLREPKKRARLDSNQRPSD
jgi:FkbM family methyltransferase